MTINAMMQATDVAARTLGITLQLLEVRGADELDRAFSAMTRDRADALLVLPSAMFFNARQRVIDLATEHQLPAMCLAREFATIGGLVAYGASVTDLYRRSAGYVDKSSKAPTPPTCRSSSPRSSSSLSNLKTAKALGLTIAEPFLLLADEVIE
jgi:putative tryptophan/tyrosine transport system substrate-binding protein